ncbi:MAG: penicillin-binding protein activator, partial [Gammaproteobacteria bacterium]|nr:penicillin-binding protein activator [Gammaproteobacteria bacterium]
MKHYFRFIILISITLILASCASKPAREAGQADNYAEELYQINKYVEAAAAFNKLARDATGTDQTLFLLRAVIATVKADQLTQALQLFNSIQINEADLKQTSLARLTRAHIALAERNAEEVLIQLKEPLTKGSSANLLAEYHELRATAFSMQGDRITTAEEYILREHYLTNDETILQNQQLIWKSLTLLSQRSLQQMQSTQATDVLSGWMELVRLSKKYQLNPTLLRASIINWQRRYTKHPVHISLIQGLLNRKQEDVTLPKNIALLLPLTGRFANPAKAIRDGLLAAYYAEKNKEDITIRIYDTKGTPENIDDIYEKAISNGAQFVIGPLNKASINKLAEQDDLSVPTLALNYIDPTTTVPGELYQFGLSPEEEALQVAERTWLDGHVNAA